MANPITPSSDIPVDSSASSNIDFANLAPYILEKFILVLEASAIIIAGIFAIRYTKKYLKKLETQHEQQRTALNLFEKITSGFIIVITITLALKIVGIDMTLLVSVSILGLSYGLQDIIKNYIAGILILFKSPFRIGDTIRIRDCTGKVEKMDFQYTTLRTFDRKNVTICNSDVMTQAITNHSNSDIRRIEIDVTLGYGSDNLAAFQIFDRLLKNHPLILKSPLFKIIFKKFSDSGIEFSIKAWVKFPCNLQGIKSDLAIQISQAFDEENIYMPYSKGIEADTDYTLTENRRKVLAAFKASPLVTTEPTVDPNFIPEMIDFDEVE